MFDATLASFFYENAFSFNFADSPSLAAVINECVEFRKNTILGADTKLQNDA